ncbi:MAG: biopolymer transporter ExbD [Candidatus Aminicenantes bacterium]|jgi:biopolymer transport protein ExbD|nr:biopolymer transporter ExbD [Candidatus Aminicenantes bacterium]
MARKAEPNVVPLCDVLLVLIIIFMVLTPSMQKGFDIKLPETTQDASSTPGSLIVLTLYSGDRVDINKAQWTLSEVGDELRRVYATRQDKTAFIRADAKLPYRKIIELLDIAKGAGVEVLGIIPEYFTEEEE